jgi:hypothetical protein
MSYKLICYGFPANSFLNGIMQMSLFKKTVAEKIEKIVMDIQNSSLEFAKGNREPLKKSEELNSGVGKVWMAEFDKIVKESGF